MKKNICLILCTAGALSLASCDDFLETSSSSVVDADFVFSNLETARAAMIGAYDTWRSCCNTQVFGAGLFYAADITGSDIERHPEAFANQTGRHYPECLYQNGTYAGQYSLLSYMTDDDTSAYARLYAIIARANSIINALQESEDFADLIAAGSPTDMTQLYGEAVALRATAYRELIRFFGDVPYQVQSGVAADGLSPRDYIYDKCLEDLVAVEPVMYRVGESSSIPKNYFSRTYVQGLIGRMALEAGGYQTRRQDLGDNFYTNGDGEVLTFETIGSTNNNSEYGRRTDWRDKYELAKTYFKACIDNSGTVTFHTTDPRSNGDAGQIYDNPYQYFFQQNNDLEFADESIYEYAMTQGVSDERPYALGRVSSGGSSNNYPCKSYGQGRINPAFYYGMFDPNDKRRDVSCCVTGSDGSGYEKLIPFTPNSVANGGGITMNKWDENRMANPYTSSQRQSGINGPYMRLSEIYLGYAEACAALNEDTGEAESYLRLVRERAFPSGQDNTDQFISECGGLLNAIIQERGFEYAGEGDRRWTLIRTGMLPDAIRNIKEMTREMLDDLASKGYHEFENGNVISNYVWTKLVDARTEYGYRLTTQCPEDMKDDPVLYPGWRGQNDAWENYGCNYGTDTPATNLAIKGLFEYIDPNSAEAAALEADGYERQDWGISLVENDNEYYRYLFYDYDYVSAPIYLWPFTPNVLSTGGFTNGYGFSQS